MSLGVKGWPDLHVVARFLDALAEGPRTRSQLQRAVGVNYDIFVRYCDLLVAREHVKEDVDGLRLTERGATMRRELCAWLEQLFGAT